MPIAVAGSLAPEDAVNFDDLLVDDLDLGGGRSDRRRAHARVGHDLAERPLIRGVHGNNVAAAGHVRIGGNDIGLIDVCCLGVVDALDLATAYRAPQLEATAFGSSFLKRHCISVELTIFGASKVGALGGAAKATPGDTTSAASMTVIFFIEIHPITFYPFPHGRG